MAQNNKVTKRSSEKMSLQRKKALFVYLSYMQQRLMILTTFAIQNMMYLVIMGTCCSRNRVRDSPPRGPSLVSELLNGDPGETFDFLHVDPDCFEKLVAFLRKETTLRDTRITVEEKLAIFLYITAHNKSNRRVQELFERSGGTISAVFHEVLNALFSIRHKVIEAPKHEEFDVIKDDEEYKYFKDCIGAIDGTYIPIAKYKSGDKYFCKDGFSCLNVMVAVDFNLKFRYVHSDCEGSVDDFRVLMKALKSKSFVIPKGAYYLADGDYEISDQFLTPYENTRYDLNEYKVTPPQKGEEL